MWSLFGTYVIGCNLAAMHDISAVQITRAERWAGTIINPNAEVYTLRRILSHYLNTRFPIKDRFYLGIIDARQKIGRYRWETIIPVGKRIITFNDMSWLHADLLDAEFGPITRETLTPPIVSHGIRVVHSGQELWYICGV